jgi:hypothetical protein
VVRVPLRNDAPPSPESEFKRIIDAAVDQALQNRRHRPQPALRAVSKRQAATAANVGISTVESAIREGELVARKIASRTVVLIEDLDRWLASRPCIKPARVGAVDQRERELSPTS